MSSAHVKKVIQRWHVMWINQGVCTDWTLFWLRHPELLKRSHSMAAILDHYFDYVNDSTTCDRAIEGALFRLTLQHADCDLGKYQSFVDPTKAERDQRELARWFGFDSRTFTTLKFCPVTRNWVPLQ